MSWFTTLLGRSKATRGMPFRWGSARPKSLLQFDQLEDRVVPTTFTVTTLSDTPIGGQLTLRQAVGLANGNIGSDTIEFQTGLSGTIVLTGGLVAMSDIVGLTTVDTGSAGPLVVSGNDASKVFRVQAGVTARILGLTIRDGFVPAGQDGAGLDNFGALTLTNCAVVDNVSNGSGGGIFNANGATLTVSNCTIAGNVADVTGGGIHHQGTTLTVNGTTISGNTANDGGGAALFGTTFLTNSTVSGNSANGNGGGIIDSGTVTLTHCTIIGNRADTDGNAVGIGGGISIAIGNTALRNSIVAGNLRGAGTTPSDIVGAVFSGLNNVVADAGSAGNLVNGVGNNVVGIGGAGTRPLTTIVDPVLDDNGGTTATHALVTGSVAIGLGLTTLPGLPVTDQRESVFLRRVATLDAGAVEYTATMTVDTLISTDDGDMTQGQLALREALFLANEDRKANSIVFSVVGVSTLTGIPLTISDTTGATTIAGPGWTSLELNGNNQSRIFRIEAGATATISGLELRDGQVSGATEFGGGIDNLGDLTVDACSVISNSSSNAGGGGIRNAVGGQLTIANSQISGNSSAFCGGIYHQGTSLTVTNSLIYSNSSLGDYGGAFCVGPALFVNCTFSHNRANLAGGGIACQATVALVNCTLTNNKADQDINGSGSAGGIYISPAVNLTLRNTIVAGNYRGTTATADDVGGPGSINATSPNNLIGDATTPGGLVDGINANFVGVGGVGVRPIQTILQTVGLNGGPTATCKLVAGSVALNGGTGVGGLPATDQRGFARVAGGGVDIGAYEANPGDDVFAPTIVNVYFDGSAWSAAFRSAAGNANGFPAQTGAGQLTPLPWSSLNRLTIVFSEALDASGLQVSDLEVKGTTAGTISGVTVNQVSATTYQINLPANAATDWYLVRIFADSMQDPAGNQLAGSFTENSSSFPTTGAANTNFVYRWKVAVGDANRNGQIRNADLNVVRNNLFNDLPSGTFNIFADMNGDGLIRNADLNSVRNSLFNDPPGTGPTRPVRGGNGARRNDFVSIRRDAPAASVSGGARSATGRRLHTAVAVNALDAAYSEI